MTIVRKGTVPPKEAKSSYPDPYNLGSGNISYLALSDAGGLTQFGAYLESLEPGRQSSQLHWHEKEDEVLYLLQGTLTVVEDGREETIEPGDACAWKAGEPAGHTIRNDGDAPAIYLIVGSRADGEVCHYPGIDLRAEPGGYVHLDGKPYPPRGDA